VYRKWPLSASTTPEFDRTPEVRGPPAAEAEPRPGRAGAQPRAGCIIPDNSHRPTECCKIIDFGAHKAVFPEAAPYCLQSIPLNRRFHCQSSTEKPSLDPPCATAAEIGDFAARSVVPQTACTC